MTIYELPIGGWRISAHRPYSKMYGVSLYAWVRTEKSEGKSLAGSIIVGAAPTLVDLDAGELSPPAFYLDDEQAQHLADTLWDCGVRPRGAMGSAGQLDAVNKHLGDMRALVAHHAQVKLP